MQRSLLAYYLATPVFALLDFVIGVNVRAVFLPNAASRVAYYGFAFACGIVALRRPALGPLAGMVESGVNIVLLVVGIYLRVFNLGDALAEGGAVSPVLTPRGMVNAALSAVVFAVSFYGNRARYLSSRPRQS